MKQALRYFALGLLISALLSFTVYYFSTPSNKIAKQSTDEMIAAINEDGYHVLPEDEYIEFRVHQDDVKQGKASKDDEKKSDKTEDKKDKPNNKDSSKKDSANKDDSKKKNDKKKDAPKKDSDDKKDDKDKSAKKVNVTIKEGMSSREVSSLLADKKVIKDEDKFVKYMESNNVSQYMQIGKFKLSTDMSYDEIADALQTYPGN